MTVYTKPERFVERGQRRRIVAEINQRGGCACCLNRDKSADAWGRSFCTGKSRCFPLCLHTPGIRFELDETTLGESSDQ